MSNQDGYTIELVLDYWDVPIEGIASADKGRYYFRALFDVDADAYSDTYEITWISEDTKALAQEARTLWEASRHNMTDATLRVRSQDAINRLNQLIVRDRQQSQPRRVQAKFIRSGRSDQCQYAFDVFWTVPGGGL